MVLRQSSHSRRQHPGRTRPSGFPLWVSDAEPGSVHNLTAARTHALLVLYRAAAAGLPTLADPAYDGVGIGIHIPVKQPPGGRDLDINTRTRNALQRSPGRRDGHGRSRPQPTAWTGRRH